MRTRNVLGMLAAVCCWGVTVVAAGASSDPQEVLADAPTDLSVTVYRSPYRSSGSIDLDYLGGFALVRETRLVRLPAGVSRVRFEGVADGIEPASAVLEGLPGTVLEKDRDARLLSPETLIAAATGRSLLLVRPNAKTGRIENVPGVILSGADADGIVFQTQGGIEALRCSGLSETFAFTDRSGLSATPTLSVLVRTTQPVTRTVQLSYLAYQFDWSADYTATLSADKKSMDLGAWVTLANGNGVGFSAAHTQVVAGRLNRESGQVEPVDPGGPMLAVCWPRGSTSDPVQEQRVIRAIPLGFEEFSDRLAGRSLKIDAPLATAALSEVTMAGMRVSQEQLGDLKLYRVPERTTVASHQSKQVRLLDRESIPVHEVFTADLYERRGSETLDSQWTAASASLRTQNDAASHLGLPLPSGRVLVYGAHAGGPLLLNEAGMRDLAVNEEVQIDMGSTSDVQVRTVLDQVTIDPSRTRTIPFLPGSSALRFSEVDSARQVQVSNGHDEPIDVELVLRFDDGIQVMRADHPMGTKNGRPMFRIVVPAHDTAAVRFQTARSEARVTALP
jgi:hypothetical protein